MASFSAGTTFTDGVANDVTAAKLGALVNNATPTSGFIQDRTAETITATNDTLLIGDASDSNNLKRITVANFAQTLPTAKITTGTVVTGTFGTTTSTAATITTGTIPTLTSGTTTGTAATFSGDLTIADKIIHSGDTNTTIRFPAADTVTVETAGAERVRVDSNGSVLIGTDINASTQGGKLQVITDSVIRRNTASTAGAALRIEKSRSATDGGYTIVQDGDTIGDIQFYGSDGVDFAWAAAVRGIVDGAPASNDMPGALLFLTSADGSQAPSERLRIDSSGNVGIGTASPTAQLTIAKAVDSATLPNTPTNHSITLYPPTTTGYYGGGISWSSGVNTPASICAVDDGGSGALGIVLATGTNTSITERLRIDSAGDVSIGTATALSKLHVHGNITLSNTTTATSAGTSTITPPATVAGYLIVSINGTSRKIPYYAT